MCGVDIPKNDTGAHARPRYRTLHSCVNRLSRELGESAPTYTAALQVITVQPRGGIIIASVCWFVGSIVTIVVIFERYSSDFREIRCRC